MAGEAAAAAAMINSVHSAFYTMQFCLSLTTSEYPKVRKVANCSCFDSIVVGGGTGGSVMASRLTEDPEKTVLLLEAGGVSPLESEFRATFPLQAKTYFDWNITAVKDEYTGKNQKDGMPATIGKGLGGTATLDHLFYIPGEPDDYDAWVKATNDSSWGYDELLKYFKKAEKFQNGFVTDIDTYHSTNGAINICKEYNAYNDPIFGALDEMGCPTVDDITGRSVGMTDPLIKSEDTLRNHVAMSYLSPAANRSNLFLLTNVQVTKVLIDSNFTAIGVQYTDADGTSDTIMTAYANNIILAAGGVLTPQLLMLSGIGPKEHLEEMNIPVILDSPQVGKNLQDHAMALIAHSLNQTNETQPATDKNRMNTGMTTAYVDDDSDGKADYAAMSILFWAKSSDMFLMCLNAFGFNEDFCQTLYDAAGDNMYLFTGLTKIRPDSKKGWVQLASNNPFDSPRVFLGLLNVTEDLDDTATYLSHFHQGFMNTTLAKEVDSQMLTKSVCSNITFNTAEYWKCYALETTVPMWHYIGTCAMGSVVSPSLQVKGVNNLYIGDSSVVPSPTRGKIGASVIMIAEKLADFIKNL